MSDDKAVDIEQNEEVKESSAEEEVKIDLEEKPEIEESEETPEEVELVDLTELDAPQEKTEGDKQHDRVNAKHRVKSTAKINELKKKLADVESGRVPLPDNVEISKRPKRMDYLTETVIDSKYNGSRDEAFAAFEDAKDEYDDQHHEARGKQATATAQELQVEEAYSEAEIAFEDHADEVRGRIKDFDKHIESANIYLHERDVLAIKLKYGKDAPMMLAALGANRILAKAIADEKDNFALAEKLTVLKIEVSGKLSTSTKISTASSEQSISGTNAAESNLDKAMLKAAKAGDLKKYQQLKAKKLAGAR